MATATINAPSFWRFRELRQTNLSKIGLCEGKEKPPCQLITGAAGSGKTFLVREMIRKNPSYARLTASTGIAAVNLGGDTKTIHSELKFFNEDSIKKAYERGNLQENIATLALRGYDNIALDEASMFSSIMLDFIVEAISDVNEITGKNMGLILVGDFLQLPPIPDNDKIGSWAKEANMRSGQYCFKARSWPFFQDNITKLTKIWRQDNPEFIEMMNMLRAGKGRDAVELMKKIGINFQSTLDKNYEGTTLIAVNKGVDDFNKERLAKLNTKAVCVSPIRRGTQLKEWDSQIPLNLWIKDGAYVMILANDVPNFRYVNGDCGWIRGYEKGNSPHEEAFLVELVRTKETVRIKRVTRKNLTDKEPDATYNSSMFQTELDYDTGNWIVGTISYHPLRLAYATSVHKSQGLSLDKVQIDTKERFFGFPSMSYVGFSRARTPEGLVVVGSSVNLPEKINISKEVLAWI
jgi:ATP-dependent DNA helicase PIF1